MEDDAIFAPGKARLGNFINYYQFNPAENRLKHLRENEGLTEIAEEASSSSSPIHLILDIGCNSGVSN